MQLDVQRPTADGSSPGARDQRCVPRREVLAAIAGLAGCSSIILRPGPKSEYPSFLNGFEAQFASAPRAAALSWFRSAGRGLFLEYGVYSQLGRGPSVQFDERIPVARYGELMSGFDPAGFDADRLAALALACGARYIGLTARHADGFCLFRTIESEFNSLESSGRDLVGELAESCERRALGLLLTYSYAADWRHPYFFPPETSRTRWRGSRPPYEAPQPEYRFENDEDFLHYVRYAHNQLQEIAYRYPALAGIRLEPLVGYQARPDLFPVGQAYSLLREARPEVLVSFGLGANGDEDFTSEELRPAQPQGAISPAPAAGGKPAELSVRLRTGASEGSRNGRRRDVAALREAALEASASEANLLLRADLLPDGSLDALDEDMLVELGEVRDYELGRRSGYATSASALSAP